MVRTEVPPTVMMLRRPSDLRSLPCLKQNRTRDLSLKHSVSCLLYFKEICVNFFFFYELGARGPNISLNYGRGLSVVDCTFENKYQVFH